MMRDITLIEISATMPDIALARPMFSAAGFRVNQERDRLGARDADTTIIVAATSREAAGIRGVEFVLNAPTASHVENLGRSTLIVGPGTCAMWRVEEANANKPD
jgi:hypothetical protein